MSTKAASAIRRGGVRIRSLGSGHTSLNLIISELSSLRQQLKDCASAEQRVAQSQRKWSEEEESPALQDILTQLAEVNELWIESQKEYIVSLKDYKRAYEKILESERKLDQARKQLAMYEEKEKKYEKELSKGSKDPDIAKRKLKQYKEAKSLAESEVVGQERETEAMKLTSIKSGLIDHSHSWLQLGKQCCKFAEVQQRLASLIPDVSPYTDAVVSYDGSKESKTILKELKLHDESTYPASYSKPPASRSSLPAATRDKSLAKPIRQLRYKKDEIDDDSFDSFDER